MKMKMKVNGSEGVRAELKRLTRSVPDAAIAALEAGGEAIATRSKALCPVDEGNLEEAHTVQTTRDGRTTKTVVSVGGQVDGVDVEDYVRFAHEADYQLGPRSMAKAAETGELIGSKFLERALEEKRPEIEKAVEDAVLKALFRI